jgi:glycosyltransferase involved in cell wall biosynthesis
LIEALGRMRDTSVSLVLTGATFGRGAELLGWAAELGLTDRVRHLGLVAAENVPVLYRHALALVFPSSYEGFGIPPLEAMACGCPVATSFETSLGEVVGDAGLRVDPADSDQMASVLDMLAGDERLRARLRASGSARVKEFSWDRGYAVHVAAYRLARGLGRERVVERTIGGSWRH